VISSGYLFLDAGFSRSGQTTWPGFSASYESKSLPLHAWNQFTSICSNTTHQYTSCSPIVRYVLILFKLSDWKFIHTTSSMNMCWVYKPLQRPKDWISTRPPECLLHFISYVSFLHLITLLPYRYKKWCTHALQVFATQTLNGPFYPSCIYSICRSFDRI
jgi:hypothetical protein